MRVVLINMPWAALHTPSLALGLLAQRLRHTVTEATVDVRYANLDCAEWLADLVPAAHLRDYDFFAADSYFLGCGDWVFSSALYRDPQWRVAEFQQLLTPRLSDRDRATCLRLHAEAPAFIDALAQDIAKDAPDLVCFTTTFQQSVASLALARRLRELAPGSRCVIGGANCDGEQGEAMHQSFSFVDFVLRGEGERAFPELVRRLIDGTDPTTIPGLCWRIGGRSGANPMTDQLLAPAEMPTPDYDAYFARLRRLPAAIRSWFEPQLVIESARGCWWGEKHHCTFCGLNGSAMTFRSKSPKVFTNELETLARRHSGLDFCAVDNILDMGYLDTAVADLAAAGHDYRIQYEIKSNLRLPQLRKLRQAGIVAVQPGIESLSSTVLQLMDKGVSGTQNVRLLRDAESLGVSVIWNYLYGFPGEQDDDYSSIISQLPALHHLQPPEANARIALERFSPYFNQPGLGLTPRRPHWQYPLIYDLPDQQLAGMAYLFDYPAKGIGVELAQQLDRALRQWREAHPSSTLNYRDLGEVIELRDTRPSYDWQHAELRTPVARHLFRQLDQPRTVSSLSRSLQAARLVTGSDGEPMVRELLADWTSRGLLFHDDGRFIQVATSSDNQWLCRLRRRVPGGAAHSPERLVVEPDVPFAAASAYQAGVRAVELAAAIDLAAPTRADIRALCVVRDATSQGMHVSWRLRALPSCDQVPGPGTEPTWLSHLYPPEQIEQPPAQLPSDFLQTWWKRFYLGRCCWRRGPGFIQVRDRRNGQLAKYTITEPELRHLITALDAGEPQVDLATASPLIDAGLVRCFGDLAWLAPYRLLRWPTPAMI